MSILSLIGNPQSESAPTSMSEETALGCVIDRFPRRESLIQPLYQTDQTFRTLCEDYCDCLKSLARWTGRTSEDAPAYQKDYRELLSELEIEIENYVNRSQGSS